MFRSFQKRTFFCIALVLLVFPATAKAEVTFNIGQGANIGITSLTAAPGTVISIDMYVTQFGQFAPDPIFNPTNMVSDVRLSVLGVGLGTIVVEIDDDGNGATAQTDVLPGDVPTHVAGPGFAIPPGGPPRVDATVRYEAIANQDNFATNTIIPVLATNPFSPPVVGMDVPGTIAENSVLMGSIDIEVGAMASGAYMINLSNSGGGDAFLLGDDVLMGPFLTPTNGLAILNVTAVPEPTSLGLAGFFAAGVCGNAIRRRRKKCVKTKVPQS